MRTLEYKSQCAVIRWARYMETKYPQLKLLHASLNGLRCGYKQAIRAKLSGMKAGVPDMFLPFPKSSYHGLFIEMKAPNGHETPAQTFFLTALNNAGYRAVVCRSSEDAIKIIEDYLK